MTGSGGPVSIKDVIEAALGPERYRQVKQQLALQAGWEEVAGTLAKRVRPVALQAGTLWLEADSPPFAQEAQLRSLQIMEAANRVLGAEVVKQVRVSKSRSS
jgi:hypothetical protein